MIKGLKYVTSVLLLYSMTQGIKAQTGQLTLEECYQLAKENYPVIKKLDLITKTGEFDIQNANKKFLPQVNFSGQATYQSEVVNYGDLLGSNAAIMGITPPTLSKDQYKIQGEVSQLLYDGGSTRNQKDLINANRELQVQNIETSLYSINSRINTIFFSILLMDEQLKQNDLNKANLNTQIQKTEAALKNGVAFRSNLDELKAEIINTEMAGTEYKANRAAYLKMLSLFIGKDVTDVAELSIPETESFQSTINRPELKAFDLQKSMYEVEKKGLSSGYLPQVSAFFQGAYGRPTLNILENKFGPWFVTGVKFSWSLNSLYTLSNKKSTTLLNQQAVEADKETFLLNTKIDLAQQDENVKKYQTLIRQDEEVISLRASVVKSAEAQLSNGVITIHEYIQKVNAENLARQNKILHEIQLLQARYNQKFITGNK
ncbi:TolC family protein [Chryseobacterium sp. Tr-659]|nr:TolC family protein [Chryseobacterium sp. Tr-659]